MSESAPTTDAQAEPAAAIASIAMFTIDCPDADALAGFYGELLGMTIAYADDNVAMLTGDHGPALGFGSEPNYTPPAWPDDQTDKQFHLDLKVADIAAAEQACLALGATKPEHQPGETWTVMLDPAGHPFCLTLWQM